MHPPHVVLGWVHYYHLPPQHSHIIPVPGFGWWATGNFCVGYGCALPCLWDILHILVSLDGTVIPQHTLCCPICSEFCVCSWRWWCRPGMHLPFSRTLPCYIYHNFAYGTMLPSAETGQPSEVPPNVVPQCLDIFGRSGNGYWFQGNPKGDINGSQHSLPFIRK